MNSSEVLENNQSVYVTSALSLTDDQKKQIEAIIKSQFQGKVNFSYKIDKNLIAGLYIRVGDKVFNATLKRKIDELSEIIQQ